MVVSAAAGETDRLLRLAEPFGSHGERERDAVAATGEIISAALTAMAIEEMGFRARSLQGFQLPIVTDSEAGSARIESLSAEVVAACFARGEIPVIAGFQGVDREGRVTTLGRGGSDLTAVALAAALKSERCDIFTDVDGVFSADPRICPDAQLLPHVDYGFMREAASLGAKVMHDRSVALGMKYSVPIHVKSSLKVGGGTIIDAARSEASCVAIDSQVARVSYVSQEGIRKTELVSHAELRRLPRVKSAPAFVDREISKVSLIGRKASSLAAQIPSLLSTMNDRGIECLGLRAGRLSLSFFLPKPAGLPAVQLLHSLRSET